MLTTDELRQIAETDHVQCGDAAAMARELLRYREAAENPSCWEIAGQLFTTKEDALKPGYIGTPEPLYDGPVLTDDREAQPVAWSTLFGDKRAVTVHSETAEVWNNDGLQVQSLFTAPPAPANAQPVASREHFESLCNQFWNWAEFDEINAGEEEPRLQWGGQNYTHSVTAALWRMYQAAPPAPVVPAETDLDSARMAVGFNRYIQAGYVDGWNACRAAMLAQPVSSGYTLPENVREALALALQTMEFMGDTLNNIDAVCTEDVEYVTPAFTAVRKLLAAAPEGGN
ncbi:hypothetical protein [Serratia inhibens]|uniref:hypothetical protein n=1 Tax=Serratia inhibens TaxID=2338073 RepID=UPI003216373C